MKKLISLMLALMMVFSMATVAFADETGEVTSTKPSTTDAVVVQVPKIYTEINEGSNSPAETFKYTIAKESVSDSGYASLDDVPMPTFTEGTADNEGEIAYNAGAATVATESVPGTPGVAALYLPEYEYVGIYTYKISETAGNTAGVEYDKNVMYLKITVIEENGKKRVAALHYEREDGDKDEYFHNTYSAGELAVKKIVTGNLGDQSKEFTVKVTFTAPNGKKVKAPITYSDSGTPKSISVEAMEDGSETVEITLKHDETVTFSNIPYGVTYAVVENDYTADGYDKPAYKYGEDTYAGFDPTNSSITIVDLDNVVNAAEKTVDITNNKTSDVDTGITLDSIPFILILAVCAGAAILFITKRRSVEF